MLNLQGDVHQIRRASDGIIVAVYDYNAWGEVLFSSGWMAQHNPLRYRGKYFDNSTGLYYLQSRFYDPVVGRFVNADGYVSTGQGILGFNMFTYCLNNPVNLSDPTGYAAQSAFQRLVMRIRIRVNTRRVLENNARLGRTARVMNPTAGQMSSANNRNVAVSPLRPPVLNDFPQTRCDFEHMLSIPRVRMCCWVAVGDGIFMSGAEVPNAALGIITAYTTAIPVVGKATAIYGGCTILWQAGRNAGWPRCCNER